MRRPEHTRMRVCCAPHMCGADSGTCAAVYLTVICPNMPAARCPGAWQKNV